MIKKLVLSVIGMMFLVLPITVFINISAFAADSDYKFDIDTGTITQYIGSENNIVVPSTIAGFPVTKIGSDAFFHNENLTSIVINSHITEIGSNAFNKCNNLKSVIINADELTLWGRIFINCKKLTTVNISGNKFNFKYSSTYASEGDAIFGDCSGLITITLPNSFEEIPPGMFSNCENLTNVFIPDSVTKIGISAFRNCSSLKNISLPNNLTEIGLNAFNGCKSLESISIPNKVKELDSGSFICDSLKNINLGNIESVSPYTFGSETSDGMPIEELTLPPTLKSFSLIPDMKNLKKLTVLNDKMNIELSKYYLSEDFVIYCGSNSNALKAAVSEGIKYVIIQTNTVVPATVSANTASVSSQKINIDGVSVDVESYNIGGNNYFKLRDIAYIMNGTEKQFNIIYNSSTNSINITPNSSYMVDGSELKKNNVSQINATPTSSSLYYENQSINLNAYNINGNNYFKLRDIAALINFGIVFDQDTNTVYIMSNSLYSD